MTDAALTNLLDYDATGLRATIPAGSASVEVPIRPLADSNPETAETIIATTALFHYSQAPRMKNPEYAELDKRSRRIVRVLSMLLRLAESLDRTHTSAIDQAHLRAVDDGSISLEILSNRDCDLELWGLKKHERAFEKTFRRPLTISTPQVSPPEKPAGNAMTVSAEK